MAVNDVVYVQNRVPFVGKITKVLDNAYEIEVDFNHELTSKNLTKRVTVYTVPQEWCKTLQRGW